MLSVDLSVDYSNIDGPPLAVKCVRKFGSALGGEVTSVCMYVCMYADILERGGDWRNKNIPKNKAKYSIPNATITSRGAEIIAIKLCRRYNMKVYCVP